MKCGLTEEEYFEGEGANRVPTEIQKHNSMIFP